MTVCIDTNVLVEMFGSTAQWTKIRHALLNNCLAWAMTTEILLEYQEVAERQLGPGRGALMMQFIEILKMTRDVVRDVSPSFRFRVITADPDDNKFIDCAITADAEWIITSDLHFRALIGSGFKPQPIAPDEFTMRFC